MMRHTLQATDLAYGGRGTNSARPLSRTLSSPLVHLGKITDIFLNNKQHFNCFF